MHHPAQRDKLIFDDASPDIAAVEHHQLYDIVERPQRVGRHVQLELEAHHVIWPARILTHIVFPRCEGGGCAFERLRARPYSDEHIPTLDMRCGDAALHFCTGGLGGMKQRLIESVAGKAGAAKRQWRLGTFVLVGKSEGRRAGGAHGVEINIQITEKRLRFRA